MSKFKGFANLAEKQESVSYQRPENYFFIARQRTADNRTGEDKASLLSKLSETASNIINFPLNQRLELGFRDIQILPNDWDTYGSPAPTQETIDLAKQICSLFPSQFQPEIMPEKDGSIGLYWEKENKTIVVFVEHRTQDAPKYLIETAEHSNEYTSVYNIWTTVEVIKNQIID